MFKLYLKALVGQETEPNFSTILTTTCGVALLVKWHY